MTIFLTVAVALMIIIAAMAYLIRFCDDDCGVNNEDLHHSRAQPTAGRTRKIQTKSAELKDSIQDHLRDKK